MDENQNVVTNNYRPVKEQDDVVSLWAFMGLQLLYCIPCIGLISAIIIAFAASNKNIRNHARGLLVLALLSIVICLVIGLIFGFGVFSILGAASSSSLYY